MRFYRWANALTVGRLIAIPFVLFLLFKSHEQPANEHRALVLLVVMQASDILDGVLARRAKRQASVGNPWGEILDPVADKLYIGCTYFTLSITHGFPKWVMAIIISRDLLIGFGWVLRVLLTKIKTIKPNVVGKAADTCQAFLIFAFLLRIPTPLLDLGLTLTVALTLTSGLTYLVRGIHEARHPIR